MSKTPLYKFQLKGVRKIHHFGGRALLADEMGLGKSIQALTYAKDHAPLGDGPAVVVCQASLKWNWQREASRHVGLRAEILEGRKPPKRGGPSKRSHVYILNYDILGSTVKGDTWLKFLKELNPVLIIVDECQAIKSRGAKRTKGVNILCRKVPHVLMLSGTPLTNRPAELFPALNILRPDLFNSFFSFASRYCEPTRKPWGWEYKGAKNLDELHALLKSTCMVRRRAADVLEDLPPIRRVIVPIDVKDIGEYQQAEANLIGWLEKTSPQKANSARKAERLVRFGYLKRLASSLKMPSVLDWMDNYQEASEEKLLVFGIHKQIISQICERYPTQTVKVDGSVIGENRQLAFDQFNRDRRTRFFVGNLDASSTGWSCTSTSEGVMVELDWRPATHTQGERRVRGLGRGKAGCPPLWYYLVAKDTIEEDLCDLLQEKQGVLDAVLDGQRVDDGLNILDGLEQVLARKARAKTGRKK